MSIENRLSKLEVKSSPEGPIVYFWAMNRNGQPMTSQEIESEMTAFRARAPHRARVVSVSWLADNEGLSK